MSTATWTTRTNGHQLVLEPADRVGQMICASYTHEGPPDLEAVLRGIRMITGPDVPLLDADIGGWTGHTAIWTRAGTAAQGWWLLRGGELLFITWMRPVELHDAHADEIEPLIRQVLRTPRPVADSG